MKHLCNLNFIYSVAIRSIIAISGVAFINSPLSAQTITLLPSADAYVRNGAYANNNYGSITSLIVKGSPNSGFTRYSYLKFSLGSIVNVKSAKLRIYGYNMDNTSVINMAVYSVNDDSWSETGITFNNAPASGALSLSSTVVNDVIAYYELDVSDFVKSQLAGDKIVSLVLKDTSRKDKNLYFSSKEAGNNQPQLLIDTTTASSSVISLMPSADAHVRNGNYSNNNYGSDTSLIVKGSPNSGFTRFSFLKFSLPLISNVGSAKLRIYGSNKDNTSAINVSVYGITDNSWTETGITFNNSPVPTGSALSSVAVNNLAGYYDLDVTNFVRGQQTAVSFVLKDVTNKDKSLYFNSKENAANKPQLIIDTSATGSQPISNALLFIENPDNFPSHDHFVFSHIQIPWTRDTVYNSNHDSLKVRIRNNGINPLVVSSLTISNEALWKIDKINGVTYNPGTQLPATVSSGGVLVVIVKFIAQNAATRAKVLNETLTINSNDDKFPVKKVYLDGLWQYSAEGSHEPYTQEIITVFGYKSAIGFGSKDPDQGDSSALKGDEIRPSYFVRSDTTRPVSIRQLAAYHNCCHSVETFKWFYKGTTVYNSVFSQIGLDGQSLLPRRSTSVNNFPAGGTMTPSGAFGIYIGGNTSDAFRNLGKKLGVRVYLAKDSAGYIIPNAYFLANDYLGSGSTNYDYNDNVYYISNVKPYLGTAYNSPLNVTPSAMEFGERSLSQSLSKQLNISNGGKTYTNGTQDPPITITSVTITGANKSEFSASMPLQTTLNPQAATAMTVTFNPATQGLKIADLLIYYSNSLVPKRVPLYGIAKGFGVTVTANFRINSGSSNAITINGKTWAADNQYSFDNLDPYTNPALKNIAGTDEDSLYIYEQSSNGDKKPFRYQFPLANGTYYVRLHFAEIYWGATGQGFEGGLGSRVFNVKLENQYAMINYDLTQDVGGATAVIKNFPVTVSDGMLNIDFTANVNRPMISAIEVYSFSSGSGLINRQPDVYEQYFDRARLYPNPTSATDVSIQFPASYKGTYNLQLVDILGKRYSLGSTRLNGGGGTQKLSIAELSLKPGVYFLKINGDNGKGEVLKLLIQ
ncbi:MAG: DNRLRE domain-containing protein [Ginsengibacter sp.]